MSLTQWLTRSTPIVSWTPVMNATFSLVPTPSALATSTGSRYRAGVEAEQAAERADLGQHAGRERRARQRPDAPDDFVAGVDVDAGLLCSPYSGASSPKLAARESAPRCGLRATRRACPRAPASRPRRTVAKNRSSSKSSSSMSKASRSRSMRRLQRCLGARAPSASAACCATRRCQSRARWRRVQGSRVGTPLLEQHRRPRPRGRDTASAPSAAADAADELLEADRSQSRISASSDR